MDNFFNTYLSIFQAPKIEGVTKNQIASIVLEAHKLRKESSDNIDDYHLCLKASYFFSILSNYFYNEYIKSNNIDNFIHTCINKYEEAKSSFSYLYYGKFISSEEALNFLDFLIKFIGDFLEILEKHEDFELYKKIHHEYKSLWYSDTILKHQINSNFCYQKNNISDAKSHMKLAIDFTKKNITLLQDDVFNEVFDIIHLRTEEINLKSRLAEFHELTAISLAKTDILLAISNLLISLKFIDEAIEINPNFSQFFSKRKIILEKITIILSENLDKWNIIYTKNKTNHDLLEIMNKINSEKFKTILSNDPMNGDNVLVINSGVLNNSGIIGNNNS